VGDECAGRERRTKPLHGRQRASALAFGLGGDDTFVGDSGSDSFSGGPGFDTISYANRTQAYNAGPVTVTLDDAANDGRAGENDNVMSDVEHVIGTAADDRLTGSPGADTLEGGDGNDIIDGGSGADTLLGGAGDDVIRAREAVAPAFADIVACGDGADIVTLDLLDGMPLDCEDVARAGV
jgi:Ca2+-binding RTX toxin-like protein